MEVAGGARRRLSAREEELLGLLAGFPDGGGGSDRELSFSDLVEAGVVARPAADADDAAPAPREDGGRGGAAAAQPSSPGRHKTASKQQQAARQRARRSGGSSSRGSCGGGGDGVLLNFYVPGLLSQSMTAPRPGRGPVPSPGAGQCAPPRAAAAATAAGKGSSDGRASVEHTLAADEPLDPVHGNGADHVLPEMLSHLKHEADVVEHLESRQNQGQQSTTAPSTSSVIVPPPLVLLVDRGGWWPWPGWGSGEDRRRTGNILSICNLQQSSQQAEEDLSQGVKALQQSVTETLASGSLCPAGSSGSAAADCSGQLAVAIGKLGTLVNFLQEADNLRLQTLQQMLRVLTTRQSAWALLAISDYSSRLRALSSLWITRPRE